LILVSSQYDRAQISSSAIVVFVDSRGGIVIGRERKRVTPWERREAISDIIRWDVATWKYGLRFWCQKAGPLRDKVGLEIGGRDGGLSLFLALNGCRVVCSDLHGPTAHAKELHRGYGVSGLVSYECVDVRRIPFPDEHFDVVIVKSVLGALGSDGGGLTAQCEALSEIRRVLKSGGRFLFAENMRGSSMHVFLRKRLVPWGRDWHYFTVTQIADLLSGFTAVDLSFRGFAATLGRREWQRSLLHNLDRVLVPLLPITLRYVVFGSGLK
jgi:SAM-dependent methyltransferase